MLTIFLCEDDDKQRAIYEQLINNTILIEDYDAALFCSCADPHTILEKSKGLNTPVLYFLDIDLNTDINGFELAQKIREQSNSAFIVFITTHCEQISLSFQYHTAALDFITKDDVEHIKEHIHICIATAIKRVNTHAGSDFQCFSFTHCAKTFIIPYEDILFFETATTPHYVLLHTTQDSIQFRDTLKKIITQLDERFFCCHRSFIVNLDQISLIDHTEGIIYFKNNTSCHCNKKVVSSLLHHYKKQNCLSEMLLANAAKQ